MVHTHEPLYVLALKEAPWDRNRTSRAQVRLVFSLVAFFAQRTHLCYKGESFVGNSLGVLGIAPLSNGAPRRMTARTRTAPTFTRTNLFRRFARVNPHTFCLDIGVGRIELPPYPPHGYILPLYYTPAWAKGVRAGGIFAHLSGRCPPIHR